MRVGTSYRSSAAAGWEDAAQKRLTATQELGRGWREGSREGGHFRLVQG